MSSEIKKWALGRLEKTLISRLVAPKEIETIMTKGVLEFALRGMPLIPNYRVEKILEGSFNNKYGGIHLLVAP